MSRLSVLPILPIRKTCLLWLLAAAALLSSAGASQSQTASHGLQAVPHSSPLHLPGSDASGRPLAMVSGDFDEDGTPDLVIGYSTAEGGSLQLLNGNPEAIAPRTKAGWKAVAHHEVIDPFVEQAKPFATETLPDLLLAADVNGDGHLDLVYASRNGSLLYVMPGDGHGGFQSRQPVRITVPGGITALAAWRPGVPVTGDALLVSYTANGAGKLGILSYSAGRPGLRASYALPAPATSITVASLDADSVPDAAIIAGGELLVLHGKNALTGGGRLEVLPVDAAESVTAGEFVFDRHAQMQLAVATTSGDLVILAHQGFDPTPWTPAQIATTRGRHAKNQLSLAQQAGNTGDAPWVEIESHSGVLSHPEGTVLVRSRISGSGGDDVMAVSPGTSERTLLRHPDSAATTRSTLRTENSASSVGLGGNRAAVSSFSGVLPGGNVVAALSMRVSPDARTGLVVLQANDVSPEFTVPSAGNTYYVNATADNTGTTTDSDDGTRCTSGSAEPCTLRDAVTFSNNDASDNMSAGKSDTIMVPAGTYNLTWQAGTTDANMNAVTHLEIFGPVTIIGATSGGGTIINGDNNDTVFTINPGTVGSFTDISVVFDASLENLVIENGKNTNNLNISANANYGGGCINWDAFGTGNLTLTDTTVENCFAMWGPGGGIWALNSQGGGTGTLTISGGSISNNSTPELGGGIENGFAPTGMSITNTTISGNIAQASLNTNDGSADGSGGGLYLEGRQPPPATPQSTLTGVTISSNVASNDDGGGIATFTGILLSGSLISHNSTGGSGGGVWSNTAGDGSQTTITSSNFLSNSASKTGGAIAMGIETQAEGNILQVSLSRIVGNTATGGASGLANGVSGQGAGEAIATENWWGCNTGPTTSADGCDQAVLLNGAGNLTTAPFAKLGITSDVTTIPPGSSMNLTVSLNTDSNNNAISGAFPAVATNYPYTFNVTGVTVSPALTTGTFNTSGVGTAVLTPSSTGPGTVNVTFDNQTDSINFTAQGTTATSLSISAIPSTTFLYGQPSGFTVQLTPSNATGITAANYQVTVDGASNIGGNPFGLILIGNNDYQIFGPFNLLSPGGHTLLVKFLGTTDFAASMQSASLNVLAGTVSIGSTVTPPNPIQGQGGTINVTVSGVGSGDQPTGSITYAFDGGATNTVGLTAGSAAISIPTLIATGGHSVSLAYSGGTNYAAASTSTSFTIFGPSQTTIAALTSTTATINVFGFGFTPPSGQLSFTDVTSGNPVAAPVTLNTATAAPALLPQVATSTGVNSLPVWTELADLNGDGKLDLITSVFGTDSVNVQLGNGDGTFQTATSILIVPGFGPAEVHAASLRGNGTLDLIVGSFNVNQIAVLLGNGNGTFQPPTLYTVGTAVNTPTSLTTGDFNHDGNLDVAVANRIDDTVSILIGNGTGSLTPLGAPIPVGHTPEAIRAGDFNNDGYSDLAVANYGDGTVTTLLNNENGTFAKTPIPVGNIAASGPQALAINGSGSSLLLAVANYNDNTVSVLQSNGNGTFGAQEIVNVGKGPDAVSFADFNNDGIQDLAVANSTDGTLSLVIGGGTPAVLGPFGAGNTPVSAAVGDLDGDGTPDIVVANKLSNNTGVFLSGTQISVPYTGLSLTAGDTVNSTYTPDGASKYGASTSQSVPVVAGPMAIQAIPSTALTQNHAATAFTPVTGSGGIAPLTYSVSPTLPTGLSMSSGAGTVTGTPTVISAANTYTVTVIDASSATATATFSLTVNSAVTATQAIASEVLTFNQPSVPFTPVTGAGGTGTLSYSIAPALRAGLSFSTATGAITGKPTAVSPAANYTVTVTDANGATATAGFSLTVNAAVTATQAIASEVLTQNHAASFTPVTGSGGTAPLTYSISAGLPNGLSFSASTGAITGTPTATGGPTSYTVTVTDSNGDTATAGFSLTVRAAVTATQTTASEVLTLNQPSVSFTPVTGAGGSGTLSYGVAPALPAGLSFSTATGAITGTPMAVSPATSYTITVTDTNGAMATANFSLAVNPATPTLNWGTPASIRYGTPLSANQLDATASVPGTFVYNPPTGTVLPPGTHTLTASFTPADTTDYKTPQPVTVTLVVTSATLVVTANSATRVYGAANPAFTGSVTGAVNGNAFTESFSTTATVTSNVGTYPIVPSATGTDLADYSVQTTNGALTITQASSATTLSASSSSITSGQSLTLTATVTDASPNSTGTPTGTVSFFDGSTLLDTTALSGGTASYATSTLASGATHTLTASYSGDANFTTSSAGSTVSVAALNFTLAGTNGTNGTNGTESQTVVPGATAAFSFDIAPEYGVYPGPVTFSVAGLPPGAVATFSPTSLAANGGAQTVVLTVQMASPTAATSQQFEREAPLALGLLLLPFLGRRRARGGLFSLMIAGALLAGVVSISGCGAQNGFNGQAVKSYRLTVTATSGQIAHSFDVDLNLQ